jgi:hypothetical protein
MLRTDCRASLHGDSPGSSQWLVVRCAHFRKTREIRAYHFRSLVCYWFAA